ncbi:MAG: phage holin family protein [Flavobacteriaceae bacterium]|nr:phage holin family protein [Flavobacteriaceae bacterium]
MDKPTSFTFWLFTLLAPLTGVIITVILLIVVDFITGSYASYVKRKPIESKRIGHTVSKFFIYNLVIISAYFLEKEIVSEVPFMKVIAGFIAIAEIKSILENYNNIYGVNPFKALINIFKNSDLKETIKHIYQEPNKNNEY